MTIPDPKFHVGQYVFFDGEVRSILQVIGFIPEDNGVGQWQYNITGESRPVMVRESSLTGDIDSEYKRMQRKVMEMEGKLNRMLQNYQDYLSKIDNLIKNKEA